MNQEGSLLSLPKFGESDHLPEVSDPRGLVSKPVELHGRSIVRAHHDLVLPLLIRRFLPTNPLQQIPYSDGKLPNRLILILGEHPQSS